MKRRVCYGLLFLLAPHEIWSCFILTLNILSVTDETENGKSEPSLRLSNILTSNLRKEFLQPFLLTAVIHRKKAFVSDSVLTERGTTQVK